MRHLLLGACSALMVAILLVTASWAGPLYQSDLVCDPPFDQATGFTVIKPNGDLYVRLSGITPGASIICRVNCKLPNGSPYRVIDFDCGGRTANAAGNLVTISEDLVTAANAGFSPGTECREPFVDIFGSGGEFCESGFRLQ